jgi:hypothetical protein
MNNDIVEFLKAAVECSVFIEPLSPGLTYEELVEIGKRAGYYEGEINDALPKVGQGCGRGRKYVPRQDETLFWAHLCREDPDYRNFDAFDFIVSELNMLVRKMGVASAAIHRDVLVELATQKGISRHDIQLAVTWQTMADMLVEKDSIVTFKYKNGVCPLPSTQLGFAGRAIPKPYRARAYDIVKDVIERRTDGRHANIEPLDAFANELEKLGYRPFRLWWTGMASEMKGAEANRASISKCVLAAALVEGALTFIVRHARKTGHFRSADYDGDPQKWKIDKLVASAASGESAAILCPSTKARADSLIRSRQRIHAGRMLIDFPSGVPDIRPDEARDAERTAEQVVREILDWLQKHPAAP